MSEALVHLTASERNRLIDILKEKYIYQLLIYI